MHACTDEMPLEGFKRLVQLKGKNIYVNPLINVCESWAQNAGGMGMMVSEVSNSRASHTTPLQETDLFIPSDIRGSGLKMWGKRL